MSNLVATHAQKASEAEQGNHIIFFSPSLKPCPSTKIFYTTNFTTLEMFTGFYGVSIGFPCNISGKGL